MHDPWLVLRDVVQGASGLLMLALGLFVASVRPRSAVTLAFGGLASAFGIVYVTLNIVELAHQELESMPALVGLHTLMWASTGIAALVLAWTFPRPLASSEHGLLVLPALVGVVDIAATLVDLPYPQGRSRALYLAESFSDAALFGLLTLLALRSRREADAGTRSQIALVASGILAYYAYWPARNVGQLILTGAPARWTPFVEFGAALLVGALFLAASRGAAARLGRNVALFTFGLALVGAISPLLPAEAGISGYLRIGMVAIVAYGIVRHRLLGIDVKVRFAISKSTMAAVFIAVFFIASEAAQQFFGDAFESGYLGILAAGALVFAIAPLSRLADRIAEKAVPVATTGAAAMPAAASDTEEVYRNALRLAIRDRTITRDEERHLFRLAKSLHIDAHRAHELLVEVEREGA